MKAGITAQFASLWSSPAGNLHPSSTLASPHSLTPQASLLVDIPHCCAHSHTYMHPHTHIHPHAHVNTHCSHSTHTYSHTHIHLTPHINAQLIYTFRPQRYTDVIHYTHIPHHTHTSDTIHTHNYTQTHIQVCLIHASHIQTVKHTYKHIRVYLTYYKCTHTHTHSHPPQIAPQHKCRKGKNFFYILIGSGADIYELNWQKTG